MAKGNRWSERHTQDRKGGAGSRRRCWRRNGASTCRTNSFHTFSCLLAFACALCLGFVWWSVNETCWRGCRRRRTLSVSPPLLSSLPRTELTLVLVPTSRLPPHAVGEAVASLKPGNEEFLVQPVDRSHSTQSVDENFGEAEPRDAKQPSRHS